MEKEKSFPSGRNDIRQMHKRLRNQMTASEVDIKSRRICDKLVEATWYQECDVIYGYYPLGKEVDCRYFLEQALADGKRVALPRMESEDEQAECRMDFYEITSLEQVAEGGFHVMEPLAVCPLMKENQAVVLVPGVVFDETGNRYGYGKGYYDRYFARFPKLYKVALAYDNQIEEELKVLDTDVRMDCVCTETGVYVTGHI